MKDILKVMRFDFLTVKPLVLGIFIVVSLFAFIISLFISPVVNVYITFVVMGFVIPLQGIAGKSDFNKLYGILPVDRKNITRARFLYIYILHFLSALLILVFIYISRALQLYRLLPDQNGSTVQMINSSFMDTNMIFGVFTGFFIFFTLLFSYMEMMGQIFGHENDIKIITITLVVIVVLILGFLALSDKGIIPVIKIPDIPTDEPMRIIVTAASFVGVLIITTIFGEITANALEKREL